MESAATTGAAPRTVDAVVRPISPPLGGGVVVAEVDHRRIAVIADEEESALGLVDVDTHALVSTTSLDGMPGQMLLAPDGTLFVAIRGAARVVALRFGEGGTTHVVGKHFTADEPYGLALTPDGATLLVTTIVDPGVEAFRAKDLAPQLATVLPRDPRSIVVSKDGARAFVSHAVGSRVSVVDLTGETAGQARQISLDATERRRDFGLSLASKKPMPPRKEMTPPLARVPPPVVRITMKRFATQGFGLAMIGEHVHIPETLVMTSDNEAPPTGYGSVEMSTLSTHVPFLARIRSHDEKLDNVDFSGPLDKDCFERKTECILPRAVTHDGKQMYVACLDSGEVLVVDPEKDAEHAPACKKTAKERTRLPVESPSALAVDSERGSAVVFSTFTRKVSILALDGATTAHEITLPRAGALPELVTLGRQLFHRSGDPRISKNGRACASCHVEGRDDALVWPTPMGKRQTPMLAGRVEGTAPYGWNGEHASLAIHIKSTLKNLEGTGLGERELEALSAYVSSMHAPPKRAATSETIARGQAIFRSSETGCSSCHVEDTHFTDLGTHHIPTIGQRFQPGPSLFDTPSLAFVGQSAPYFHDGRFATLEDVVDGCERPDTAMGKTKHLAPEDRRALVAYLRSL